MADFVFRMYHISGVTDASMRKFRKIVELLSIVRGKKITQGQAFAEAVNAFGNSVSKEIFIGKEKFFKDFDV